MLGSTLGMRVLLISVLGVTCQPCARGCQFDSDKSAAIDHYVKAEMAREHIPGVEVGIYCNGKAVFEKGYGMANVELQVPVRPETLMQSGSVGKQFAAAAVMMLVEQGKVHLEDSIANYFPDAPSSWRPIKVKNLLSHTSGLAEYETSERTEPGGEFDLTRDFTENQLVHKIEELPIEFYPGERWAYRNTNYALIGFLITRVTGMFYGDYLRQKIFVPLDMNATRPISNRDIIPNRAAGYEIKNGVLKNQLFVSQTFNSTADGTLYFNVSDLQKWDQALYGTMLLTKASLNKMWTPFKLNDGRPNPAGYGFAWGIHAVNGHRVLEHSGAWQGFTCDIARYVDDGLTVVVLTNLDSNHARPTYIERVVAGIVAPALMPKIQPVIEDNNTLIAADIRLVIEKVIGGENVDSYYVQEANRDPIVDRTELSTDLPSNWETSPIKLVRRVNDGGVTISSYRLGNANDYRLVSVTSNEEGKIITFSVSPDPDNR